MNPYYAVVSKRAGYRCEYCRAPEIVFNFPFEVEHIIPIARKGKTDESNLALACRSCNLRKGIRIGGNITASPHEIQFFHPRKQIWSEHFKVDVESGQIVGETLIGKVTVQYLSMNASAQIAARKIWIHWSLFP
ncbi:MAG: HNH endonuclease signature motif containing protein [Cyanobacteria bacterium J06621_11]